MSNLNVSDIDQIKLWLYTKIIIIEFGTLIKEKLIDGLYGEFR